MTPKGYEYYKFKQNEIQTAEAKYLSAQARMKNATTWRWVAIYIPLIVTAISLVAILVK